MKNLYLFDCFGVLISPCGMPFFIRHFGKEKAKEKFDYYLEGTNIGDRTFLEMITMVANDLSISKKEVISDWIMNLSINWELLNFIKELRKTNYVAILSNAASGLVEAMMKENGVDLSLYFDKVFISADYHKEKPNFDFYQVALEAFKDKKINKVIMVDDQWKNLEKLPQIGIIPVQMENNEKLIKALNKLNN